MCLIAYAPKGELIPREVLSFAANQNGDGIGVMSSDGIHKYLGKKMLKRARRYIEELSEAKIPYAVHLRWATHGAICVDNTHPYKAPEGNHWIMHNGIIHHTTAESSAKESDTAVYVRKFLYTMPDFEDTKYYKTVGTHIGWGNKFIIMDRDARFQICNEEAGVWIEGMWFSNTYSLPNSFIPVNRGYYGVNRTTYYNSATEALEDATEDGRAYQLGWKFCAYLGKWYNPATHEVIEKKWMDGETSKMIVAKEPIVIEQTGNKDFPRSNVVPLLPRHPSGNIGVWASEDRAAYYEALEAGMTPTEAADYLDPDPTHSAVLEALRDKQERTLAAAYDSHDKPDSPIGGDFPDTLEDTQRLPLLEVAPDPDENDEEETKFKRYLRAVAATVHV